MVTVTVGWHCRRGCKVTAEAASGRSGGFSASLPSAAKTSQQQRWEKSLRRTEAVLKVHGTLG